METIKEEPREEGQGQLSEGQGKDQEKPCDKGNDGLSEEDRKLLTLPTLILGEHPQAEEPNDEEPKDEEPNDEEPKPEDEGGISREELEMALEAEMAKLAAAPLDESDVRKTQLTMRATELAKKEMEKEEKKEKKEMEKNGKDSEKVPAEKPQESTREKPLRKKKSKRDVLKAAGKAKAKGRPRKGEDPVPEPAADAAKDDAAEDGAAEVAEPEKKKRRRTRKAADGDEEAPAKKPRRSRARHPAPPGCTVDETTKLEMQALLTKFDNKEYDKKTEDIHQKKFKTCNVMPYWTRSATAIKVVGEDGKVHQVAYFSKMGGIAVTIHAANKMAEMMDANGGEKWLKSPAGQLCVPEGVCDCCHQSEEVILSCVLGCCCSWLL